MKTSVKFTNRIMKATFIIDKFESGYKMKVFSKRLNFLKAFFTGRMEIHGNKSQGDYISKSLYTSKKKVSAKITS